MHVPIYESMLIHVSGLNIFYSEEKNWATMLSLDISAHACNFQIFSKADFRLEGVYAIMNACFPRLHCFLSTGPAASQSNLGLCLKYKF